MAEPAAINRAAHDSKRPPSTAAGEPCLTPLRGAASRPQGQGPALPGRPPLHPNGEGAGGEVHRLSALKSALCDALWPTWSGCMYGRSCDADHRIRFDAQLDELADHFGDRLVPLAMEIHREMTRTGTGAPRTFLGHMQKLRNLMLQELQSAPAVPGSAGGSPAAVVSPPLQALAVIFLKAIGFAKPPLVKVEATLSVFAGLTAEGYTLDEIRIACDLAASMGAHGPGLIPHMVGREAPAPDPGAAAASAHVEDHAALERASRDLWTALARQFDNLLICERDRYINDARACNRHISERPPDHPLVRAAAIRIYAQEVADETSDAVPPLHPSGEGAGGEVHA